jgi:type II protein arginine methyltransferase
MACAKVAPPWHFPMMADAERNAAYDAAIRRAAKGRHVLDIGTGSGLLAMMAARAGADSVTTCEVVGPIARAAGQVIAANGLSDRIRLHAKHSDALEVGVDMADRADLLVTETFASGVLSESVLPTIEHARRHLLTEDATIIPSRAAARGYLIGGQAIEGQLFAPHALGFDLSPFDILAPNKAGLHLDRLPHEVLSEDFEIFDFDLVQSSFAPERRTFTITATRSGRCVGVAQWLWLRMDEETTYENRPQATAGANGWMHVVYRFPRPVELKAGDQVHLLASHGKTAMTVTLATG